MYRCKYVRMLMEANLKKIYLHFVQPIYKREYRHMMIEANLNVYLHFVSPSTDVSTQMLIEASLRNITDLHFVEPVYKRMCHSVTCDRCVSCDDA